MAAVELIAAALARALSALTFALLSEDDIKNLVALVGWTLPSVPPSLLALRDSLVQVHTSLADLTVARAAADLDDGDSSAVDSALESLAADLAFAFNDLRELPARLRAELPASFVAATHIDEELESRIFDRLLSIDMGQNAAVLYHLLRVAGVIEFSEEPEDPAHFQPAFERYRIRWNRLLQLTDPGSLARDVYGWGTPALDTARLFRELVPLAWTLGMPCEVRYADAVFTQRIAPGTDPHAEPLPRSRSCGPMTSRCSSSRLRLRRRLQPNRRALLSRSCRRPAANSRSRSATDWSWTSRRRRRSARAQR